MKSTAIDQYIAQFPDATREILEKVRATVARVAPRAEETINYQIPTFKLKNKNLVHFAGYKNHIGFYPTPSGITAFSKELKAFDAAKGSVKFPISKPLPYELIAKMVEFRVNEINNG